jgi:hypothetical protein
MQANRLVLLGFATLVVLGGLLTWAGGTERYDSDVSDAKALPNLMANSRFYGVSLTVVGLGLGTYALFVSQHSKNPEEV